MAVLKSLTLKNLTVFPTAELSLAPGLNVFIGENGAGKTHLLKVIYSVLAALYDDSIRPRSSAPIKATLQASIAEKLVNVFRPESLGRLASRTWGKSRCEVKLQFDSRANNISFFFSTNSKSEVKLRLTPSRWPETEPAYLPTRELLSIYPNFVSFYEGHYLEFEETWRDTCSLLGRPLQRGPKEQSIAGFLDPLENAMGGRIELDRGSGRFYLRTSSGRMEIPLVAEGIRKLGMLARLIATGALLDRGYLFWDEPEANLNPKLVRQVAETIVRLSVHGIQVFVATHSLFLLRELEICIREQGDELKPKFFGLHRRDSGVEIMEGTSIDDIGEIPSLEEELKQSDRFLNL
jgi:energy-coupling factor transporter ATP-binding protein EcfA2